jgi:hypothetical protein
MLIIKEYYGNYFRKVSLDKGLSAKSQQTGRSEADVTDKRQPDGTSKSPDLRAGILSLRCQDLGSAKHEIQVDSVL